MSCSLNASSPEIRRSTARSFASLELDEALLQRRREPGLLRVGDLADEGLVLPEFGVGFAEQRGDGGDHVVEDPALDPQPSGVRDHAPEHAAQDVTTALVRRLHPVGDQERGRAAVLRDDLQRGVVARVGAVRPPRPALPHLEDRPEQVRLEDVVDPLEQHRDALQAGPRVHVLRRERLHEPQVAVDPVLDEHEVPDLHEPLFVHVRAALGTVGGTAVDEDLAARSRRPGRVGVPVVRRLALRVELAAPDDPPRRDPDPVDPGARGLVVVLVDGHPQPVVFDAVDLGDELVRPRDRVGLEVVREREVAEHLEEREVAGVPPDVLDVVGPHHLLRGDGAAVRRLGLAQEVRDELVHPGVRQEQTRLRRRDQ